MAERRRPPGTRPTARSRARPPADREVANEDATEPASRHEQEAVEAGEGEPEAAERDEFAVGSRRNGYRRGGSSLTAKQAARMALRQILELTDKQAESITGVERGEDGWTVSIEVVEDRRIPSSADILATYEARIDGGGELMSYRRVRRYSRGRGDSS